MISNELKNILKSGTVYIPDSTLYISTSGGEIIEFTGGDLLSGIEVEQTLSPIGGLAIGQLVAKLQSFDETIEQLLDIDDTEEIYFKLVFGTEIYESERYLVDKIETSEDRLELTITAYENLMKLNVKYVEPVEEYPITAAAWLSAFAAQYGLEIDGSRLPFINDTIEQPNLDNISARDVLVKFLEWNVSAAKIENGVLVCRPLEVVANTEAVETLDRDSVSEFTSKKNDLGTLGVNTLTLSLSEDVETENFSVNDAAMIDIEGKPIEVRLSSNPFLSTPELRELYAPLMFPLIRGFNFHAYELETRALYLRPGDTIEQVDLDSFRTGTYNIPVYNYKMSFDGEIKVKLGADIMESAATVAKYTSVSPTKRTEVRVNKLEGTIELVAERQDETTTEMAAIAVNSSEISLRVSSFEETTEERFSDITIDIDDITDRVVAVESDLETNYSTIEYSNELTRNAVDGLTNTYSRLGGANLVMNSALYHGSEDDYDHWRGNLVRLVSDDSQSRTAIGLKNGTVYQEIANVQTGWISLRFYVGIQAGLDDGQVQFKINETLYDVVPNNFVEMSFEHTQSSIELSFITNMSGKYYISDLMMNYGNDIFLDYQQAQNELHTSSVQISERIRVESSASNTITYLGANGLEGYNKSTGDLVFKQTDTGLEAVSIKSGNAEIAGIAITKVGNQTWFTGL